MIHQYHFKTHGPEETNQLAQSLAAQLEPGDILAMSGNLASGKTTFTQGLTTFFEIKEYALSPTFTYINEYHGAHQDIIHIDAYRLNSGEELISMGIWEYFDSGAIVIIEWADIVAGAIPEDAFGLSFRVIEGEENGREILIHSPRALELNL
ncbi:MAG: tRNA (adenosine(37)-N6)-threonylcarbamoyltransferase complex ATPase subunit type 1 TsaE [FCB group bacterium]|nr:tRNA (adenosine(37)-N6)-threonylcarbamoyltransferase complex ATPase subunit type 1 TsaE [FCB group bacterium]MBL7028806.1 tRNA (adenosine(37)-N6)-threonylcarbamoyltransferase complex ATPase subunit type 1 TsaE [Candidatus Neomarinimicrobiota bacterium]MBL7121310.1 tRNA (adenosine(37)-N6)-threonylcarbamoyltransferase complex ATPase subunit type 1 TsaE [Candidatus Neomarinimicrobiota bacterium]